MSVATPSTTTRTTATTREDVLPEQEKQVIVHCHYFCTNPWSMAIRIWPTTFLIAKDVNHRSQLIHAENIPYFPIWKPVALGSRTRFTLVFSGLPADCTRFDMVEDIPEPGGFIVCDIPRNELDVYAVRVGGQ